MFFEPPPLEDVIAARVEGVRDDTRGGQPMKAGAAGVHVRPVVRLPAKRDERETWRTRVACTGCRYGWSAVRGWQQYLYLNAIQRFLRDARAVDVHIVNQEIR